MSTANSSLFPPWAFRLYRHNDDTAETADQRAAVVIAYSNSWFREILHWSFALSTAGIYLLLVHWFPELGNLIRYSKTTDIFKTARFIVISEAGQRSLALCRKVEVSKSELKLALPSFKADQKQNLQVDDLHTKVETIVFEYRCLQFLFNIWTREFEHLSFNLNIYPSEIHTQYSKGVSSHDVLSQRQNLYGPGCVEVPTQPLFELIISEIFHPLYVFQMASIALWLWDQYYQYAGAVIAITLISLCTELYEARRSQIKLKRMAKFVCQVSAVRQHGYIVTSSSSSEPCLESQRSIFLVPGDVIEVYRGMTLPCDVLLLSGTVIVNESMLTGESLPIIKNFLPNIGKNDGVERFDVYKNLSHVLFGGTEIVAVRKSTDHQMEGSSNPLALVIRTGFCTTQGQMMISILHPTFYQRSDFKYETYKFLAVLAALAFLVAFLSMAVTFSQGLQRDVIIIRTLDTFTLAIPPALPATMTVGTSVAISKLRRFRRIMCIAPSRVNYAGQVNTLVFDKTGTLTEEGLDLEGVIVSKLVKAQGSFTQNSSGPPSSAEIRITLSSLKTDPFGLPNSLLVGMATCHSVVLIDDAPTGEPIETQLLSFTGWKVSEEPLPPPFRIMDAGLCDIANSLDEHLPCLAEVFHLPKECPTIKSERSLNLLSIGAPVVNSLMIEENGIGGFSPERLKCIEVFRIVRRFDFIPELQRMSVIVWDRQRLQLRACCKGSPEQLCRLCLPSTIPIDLVETLRQYTGAGMRVLAIASKEISLDSSWEAASKSAQEIRRKIDTYPRAEIEAELIFDGLAVFANGLKPDSRGAIAELMDSGCCCLMATGDNALTAISVARNAGLIPSTSTSIVVGEVVQNLPHTEFNPTLNLIPRMFSKIIWPRIVYSPMLALLEPSTDMHEKLLSEDITSSAKKLPAELGIIERLMRRAKTKSKGGECASSARTRSGPEVGSKKRNFASDGSSGNHETEMFVTFEQHYASKNDEADGKPFEDLREYLAGKDPRSAVVVLTGPAFRLLEVYHKTMGLGWSNVLLGEKQMKEIHESRCVSSASRKKKSNWQAKIALEIVNERASSSEVQYQQLENVRIEYDDRIKERMILRIAVDNVKDQPQRDGRIEGYKDQDQSKSSKLKKSTDSRDFAVADDLKDQAKDSSSVAIKSLLTVNNPTNGVEHIEMSLFEYCLRFCRVYARMTPDDKATLVESLQSLPNNPFIGMCGDGANDIQALKRGNIGISLSEKEASIASPFTSTNKTVQSAVDILREGRCALTNSFQSFKFITVYALVQLSTVSVLYYYGGNLTDPQYLWIDLIVALPLAMTMAWTNASSTLSSRMPSRRLVGLPVILSIIGQVLIQLVFLGIGLGTLSSMSFYVKYVPDNHKERFDSDDLTGYENMLIFVMSNFQYITINFAFCMGKPWRKHPFTNWAYTLVFICLIIHSSLILIAPHETFSALSNWLSIIETPFFFRSCVAAIIILNSIVTICFERYIIIRWAVRKEEITNRPSHAINMALPLDRQRRVRIENP